MFSFDICIQQTNIDLEKNPMSENSVVGAAFALEPAGDHDSNVSKSITCEDGQKIMGN